MTNCNRLSYNTSETMIKVTSLVWDEFNSQHIRLHGVTIVEAEEAVQSKIKVKKTYEDRLLVFGKTKNNRFLTLAIAPKGDNSYYVVTARNMSRKERRWYQQ